MKDEWPDDHLKREAIERLTKVLRAAPHNLKIEYKEHGDNYSSGGCTDGNVDYINRWWTISW